MDALDLKIIGSCNKLIEIKTKAANARVDNRNERARLKRELDQKHREIQSRFRTLKVKKDLTVYQECCSHVFDKAGIVVPGLAAVRQAQLCLHVHLMTMTQNQKELLMLHSEDEQTEMYMELKRLRETITLTEIELLNRIVEIEQENREFREWMETPLVKTKNNTQQEKEEESRLSTQNVAQMDQKQARKLRTSSVDTVETDLSSTPPSSPDYYERELLPEMHQSAPSIGEEHLPQLRIQRQNSAPRSLRMMVPARPQHLHAS